MFVCPECKTELDANTLASGSSVKCPSCGFLVQLDADSTGLSSVSGAPGDQTVNPRPGSDSSLTGSSYALSGLADSDPSSEAPSTDNPPDATLEASPRASSVADDDLTPPDVEATMVFGGRQDDDDEAEPFLLGDDEEFDEDLDDPGKAGGESLDATIDFGRLANQEAFDDLDFDGPGDDATLAQAGRPSPNRPRIDLEGSDAADDLTVMLGMEGLEGASPSHSDKAPASRDDATLAADSEAADSSRSDSDLPSGDSAGELTESPSTHPGDGSSDRDSATLAFDSERRSDHIGTPEPREITGLESGGTIPRGPLEQGRGSRSLKPGESQIVGAESVRLRAFLLAEPSGDDKIGIDYAIEEEAGKGGMGVVYKARQQSLDRLVAIKQIKSEAGASESDCSKFVSEAVITGQLEHPNVIPVHDLGLAADGMPFYAMKFVEGDEWEAKIKELSEAENLSILIQVAQAIAFAHSKEVLHRDLKPGNIMLGKFGEVLVMDWGLAARLDDGSDIQPAGTPIYMPPETALEYLDYAKGRVVGGKRSERSRKRLPAGKYSDIYLLGALLFKIVARRAPHRGKSTFECLRNAAKNEIVKVRRSSELLDIAYRAMATDPEDRYPTAIDFIEALKAYQSHAQSIQIAKTASRELRAAEKLRKEESADTTEIYACFSRAQHGYQNALDLWSENRKAARRRKKALRLFAEAAYENGDYDLALSMLDADSDDDAELRATVLKDQHSRDSRLAWFKTLQYATAVSLVLALAFIGYSIVAKQDAIRATNEATLAKEEARVATETAAKETKRADVARREAVAAKDEAQSELDRANRLKKEADEAVVARDLAEERERRAEGLARVAGEKLRSAKQAEAVARDKAEKAENLASEQAYLADLGRIRTALIENGTYAAWDVMRKVSPQSIALGEGKTEWEMLQRATDWQSEATELVGEQSAVGPTRTVVSDDGSQTITVTPAADKRTVLTVYAADANRPTQRVTIDGTANDVASSKDGRFVAVTGETLRVVDTESGSALDGLGADGPAVSTFQATCVAFHPTQPEVLVGRADTSVERWVIADGTAQRISSEPQWHQTALTAVGYSPDGSQRFSADASGRIVLWRKSVDGSLDAREVYSHASVASGSPVITAAKMTDDQAGRLAYGCDDGSVYEIADWWPAETIASEPSDQADGLVRPRVVKRLADGYVDVRPHRLNAIHPQAVTAIDYDSEEKLVLSAGGSTLLVQRSKASGRSEVQLKVERRYHDAMVLSVAAGPDSTAYSSDEDGRVIRWKINVQAKELALDPGPERRSGIVAVDFQPDENGRASLSVAGENGFVHRWGDVRRSLDFASLYAGHADNRDMQAWHIPGAEPRIVTVAADNRACIWRESDGLLDSVIDLERRTVVAVDPERRLLYAASDGRSLGGRPAVVAIPFDGGAPEALWQEESRISFLLPLKQQANHDPVLAVGQRDGQVFVWGPKTGRVDLARSSVRPHWRPIQAMAHDSTTGRLYTGDSDSRLVEWDLSGVATPVRRDLTKPARGSASIVRLEVSPGRGILALQRTPGGATRGTYFGAEGIAGVGAPIKRRGLRDASMEPTTGRVVAVCRSEGKSVLAFWTKDGAWHEPAIEPTSDRLIRVSATDEGCLSWGPGSAQWRKSSELQSVSTLVRSRPRLGSVLQGRDDSTVRAISEIGSIDRWDTTASTARQGRLVGDSKVIASCPIDGGKEVVIALLGKRGRTRIERWDIVRNQRVQTLASGLPASCRAMTSAASTVAVVFDDRMVLLDTNRGQERSLPINLFGSQPTGVSLSTDGLQVAITTSKRTAVLGRGDAAGDWRFSKLDREGVTSAAFTTDGSRLIVGVESGRVILLEVGEPTDQLLSSRPLLTFAGHSDRVTHLQVEGTQAETTIVSGDASGRVVVRSL